MPVVPATWETEVGEPLNPAVQGQSEQQSETPISKTETKPKLK